VLPALFAAQAGQHSVRAAAGHCSRAIFNINLVDKKPGVPSTGCNKTGHNLGQHKACSQCCTRPAAHDPLLSSCVASCCACCCSAASSAFSSTPCSSVGWTPEGPPDTGACRLPGAMPAAAADAVAVAVSSTMPGPAIAGALDACCCIRDCIKDAGADRVVEAGPAAGATAAAL
jgi:hypothetical protein